MIIADDMGPMPETPSLSRGLSDQAAAQGDDLPLSIPLPASLRIDLPSQIDLKAGIIDLIVTMIKARDPQPSDALIHWLRLALEELITNAVIHGHEGDPDLLMTIRVWQDQQQLWYIRIDDQGDGFAPSAVPDPEDPESLLLERGRGIRLASHGVSGLRYFRGGRAAVIILNIDELLAEEITETGKKAAEKLTCDAR